MTHQTVSLEKYWKLFAATLSSLVYTVYGVCRIYYLHGENPHTLLMKSIFANLNYIVFINK